MKNKSTLFLFSCFILAFSLFAQSELVGPLSKEDILKHHPEWNTEIAAYFPKPEILEKLRNISSPLDIKIYLGTWCPDCRENVSAYFKIIEMIENPNIHTLFFGIPRDRNLRQNYTQETKIEKVPTFIVTINGVEKGRIIEQPKKSLEEDLLEIIMR